MPSVLLGMGKIIYQTKSKFLITPDEREMLDWLHFEKGEMWQFFTRKDKIGIVTLAKKDEIVVGWSLLFERFDQSTLFLWVRKDFRRQKIGTELVKINLENFGQFDVSKWDKRSRLFYESVGVDNCCPII